MTKTKTKIALLVGALLAASPAAAVTNLLTNGSFENGLTGWSESVVNVNSTAQVVGYSGGNNDTITTNPSPDAVGSNAVYFTTDTGSDTLSQTVSLIAGHTYSLGFDYAALNYQNPYPFTMILSLGGQTLASVSSTSSTLGQWYTSALSTTATSTGTASYSFVFSGGGNPARDVLVDRAYLIDTSAVPEPASWAMMIGGFALIGGMLRQRRADRLPA